MNIILDFSINFGKNNESNIKTKIKINILNLYESLENKYTEMESVN